MRVAESENDSALVKKKFLEEISSGNRKGILS